MHRLLAIVLLALLPLQFSWAAVASYCVHEAPAGVGHLDHFDHFGHHPHAHQHTDDGGLDAGAQDPANEGSGATHSDCGPCHGHGYCGAMLPLQSAIPGALSTAAPSATVDEHGAVTSLTRPERPKWQRLA